MDEVDAMQSRHHARVETVMRTDHRVLAEMYVQLEQQLASPPVGWFTLGAHSNEARDITLEFWGVGNDGLPIWERPLTFETMFAGR